MTKLQIQRRTVQSLETHAPTPTNGRVIRPDERFAFAATADTSHQRAEPPSSPASTHTIACAKLAARVALLERAQLLTQRRALFPVLRWSRAAHLQPPRRAPSCSSGVWTLHSVFFAVPFFMEPPPHVVREYENVGFY